MVALAKQPNADKSLVKYTRQYLLDAYDGLYRYKKFANLSLDDFPARPIPLASRKVVRSVVDPNLDEDGQVDDADFFSEHESDVEP